MTEKLTVKEINDKYIELWKEFEEKKGIKEIPSLYPELKNNALLFVGINPSCPDSKLKKRLQKMNSDLTPEEFKALNSSSIEDKKEVIKNERNIAKGRYGDIDEPYQYFKPFKEISKEMGLEWEHIDVFRTIAKTQSELKDILDISSNGKNICDFGLKQVDIFKELLETLEPKIIVVQNALARDIIQNEYDIGNSNWNENEGFHTIGLNGKEIPIFFSGMLSGRRRLDKGSEKRLIWHIKKAKKWIERQ